MDLHSEVSSLIRRVWGADRIGTLAPWGSSWKQRRQKKQRGKWVVMLNHHALRHLVHSCSKLPECEHIFKENHHQYYITEGKLNSFANIHNTNCCLGTSVSHMVIGVFQSSSNFSVHSPYNKPFNCPSRAEILFLSSEKLRELPRVEPEQTMCSASKAHDLPPAPSFPQVNTVLWIEDVLTTLSLSRLY